MEFDLGDYKRRTARLVVDDLDFDAFRDQPLDVGALRCLRYMHDVEYHTVCYLRDLLLTPAHADPVITAFLGFWVYEEYWHGEALAAVLDAHDEPSAEPRVVRLRRSLGWRDRVRPLLTTAGATLAGRDFVAVHMSWGAINEWSTQAGYGQLAQRGGHPLLAELLRRIMRQEGRHIDFYASEAERRLARSPKARRLTRFALRRLWRPVGTGVMPPAEARFVIDHLFGDADGREVARRIDRRVDRLPGLDGLHLLEGAVAPVDAPTPATLARVALAQAR